MRLEKEEQAEAQSALEGSQIPDSQSSLHQPNLRKLQSATNALSQSQSGAVSTQYFRDDSRAEATLESKNHSIFTERVKPTSNKR